MSMPKPANYRPNTWAAVSDRLSILDLDQLIMLAQRGSITTDGLTRDEIAQSLVSRGGFLLIELELIADPEFTIGTVFSLGGLEYVIRSDAAKILMEKTGVAELDIVGGGRPKSINYNELIKAIYKSPAFDQLLAR